jgi:hypothetical protein
VHALEPIRAMTVFSQLFEQISNVGQAQDAWKRFDMAKLEVTRSQSPAL